MNRMHRWKGSDYNRKNRVAHKTKKVQEKYGTFEPFIHPTTGVEIVQHRVYRFKWQTTLAHWHLCKVEGSKVIMESKHGSVIAGKLDDLVSKK